jgi:membrane protease YdiL (CAAX protease family)
MSAPPIATRRGGRADALVPATALVVALATVVATRWTLASRAPGEGLLVGLAFGAGLLAIGIVGGWRLPVIAIGRASARGIGSLGLHLAIGSAAGLTLLALAVLVGREGLPDLRPAVPFLPWAAVTALVATAEEVALRGALFAALDRAGGPVVAVLVTSAAFAVMHVPFYGWSAVPLDLGVGLLLGGLRLWTGGVAAPATAHVLADLATWWL